MGELERVTTAPADGATPLSVTVPVEVAPATTVVGFSVREINTTGTAVGVRVGVVVGVVVVGTVVVGILWFHEPSSTVRVLLILAIVGAIAALRMTA